MKDKKRQLKNQRTQKFILHNEDMDILERNDGFEDFEDSFSDTDFGDS